LEDHLSDFILLAPSFYNFTSYALVDGHMPTAWLGSLLCSFIAQQCSVLASVSLTVLFIAGAKPWAVGEVMTLSPHGLGTCRHVYD
jgi:hypothetical protein